MRVETEVAVAETSAAPEFEGNLQVFEPQTDKSAESADLTPAEGTASQPARQAWSPEVAVLSATDETQLVAEIRLLFENNKRNRFKLGEKLWYLREGAKHGQWLKKVAEIGIKERTARALVTYYREERDRSPIHSKKDEPMPFDPQEGNGDHSVDLEEEKPKKPRASAFKPVIVLKWGTEEVDWNKAIEVIIAHGPKIQNKTEAALYAVMTTAKRLEAEFAAGNQDASVASRPATRAEEDSRVKVEPPLDPERIIMPLPPPLVDAPPKSRSRLLLEFDPSEEVLQ